MNTEIRKRRGLAALYRLCPAAHIIALISALIIALHLLLRGNYALMQAMSQRVIRPLHRLMAVFAAHFEFSLAELLIGIFAACIAGYILVTLVLLIVRPGRLRRLYTLVLRLLAAGLAVYALFCLLWGTYYYGDSFLDASGLESGEVSAEQLETVTVYFADLLNQYGREVERGENGQYAADRAALLARSDEVFRAAEEEFPCLEGPDIRAKGVHFSRVMSYLDFTGFFFPFTAEANVNTDFPGALFASTIAHELSHQRGVAREQEANFTAVLACLEYGDADYCYSACLLAYTHLGNALFSADPGAWQEVYRGLSDGVIADLAASREYWAQFETPVQSVSNTVYEGFLQSYDQKLGMRSYGACVDLLVNYYYETALAHFGLA